MSDRCLTLKDIRLSGNFIPTGRQLHRTPPLMTATKHLDFSNEDSNEDQEEPQQNMEPDSRDQNGDHRNTMFEFNPNPDDSSSMLKGMKGYKATPDDLEFIKKMKAEKINKELQGELEELQRLLQKEKMHLEQTYVCRDRHLIELKKFPSCEDVIAWAKAVIKMTSLSTDLTDKDGKSLLAMVTPENIQRAIDDKRLELTQMKKMLANKKKKEAKERTQLERKIARDQLKIQMLMRELLDLQSDLSQQGEVHKTIQMQIDTQEAPEMEAEEVSDDLQAAKVRTKSRERTKTVKTEKQQDATIQSKSTRSKHTDNQTSVKDANQNTAEILKTEKPPKSAKEARGPQPNTQSQMKSGEARPVAPSQGRKKAAVAAGDTGDPGLRRSKRIASRK
ncbi:hypothetical protein ABVT39_010658 [Epinephelus coioides]